MRENNKAHVPNTNNRLRIASTLMKLVAQVFIENASAFDHDALNSMMKSRGFAKVHFATRLSCFEYVWETELSHDVALSRAREILSDFGKRFVILLNSADGSKRSGSFG
jgi:hypothetical protein